MTLAGRDEADRFDAEIAEDLGAKADIAPRLLARGGALGFDVLHVADRHASRSLTQIDQHAGAGALENLIDGLKRAAGAEHIGDNILAMKPDGYVLAAVYGAENQRQMVDAVEGRRISDGAGRPDRRLDRKGGLALDQPLAGLAMGNEVGDGNDGEPVLAREVEYLRATLDGAVVIDELRDDPRRMEACKPGEIDRRLGMARAHEHATRFGDQWKNVSRPHEVACLHIAIGKRMDRG